MNTGSTRHPQPFSRDLSVSLHRAAGALPSDHRTGEGSLLMAAACVMAICACQGNSAQAAANRMCEQAPPAAPAAAKSNPAKRAGP